MTDSEEWLQVTVDEIKAPIPNALATGPFGSSIGSRFFQNEGTPVIRGSNLSESIIDRLIENDFVFLSPEKAKEFERSSVILGDLVFTCWGTIGQVGLIDSKSKYKKYIISNKQMKLTPNPKIADSLFLYYVFLSPTTSSKIKNQAIGSSVPGFNLGQLKSIVLDLPPLKVQKSIASILGALDNKIELNRRMNTTLEATARAIFKSWFVDFDPVKANVEGRQLEGLSAEMQALFPSSFDGDVPSGWETATLDSLEPYVLGGDWGKDLPDDTFSESVLCIRGADIAELQYGALGKMPTRFLKPASLEKRKLKEGDIVIEISGGSPTQSTGRAVYISPEFLSRVSQPVAYSNFSRLIRLPEIGHSIYFYHFLRHLYDENSLMSYETGTTGIKNFAFTDFSNRHPLIIPIKPILDEFANITQKFMAIMQHNGKTSDSLASTRDTLLPKLLSGELQVKDAEHTLEGLT
jgi:type I restriction enzyme, S subunit